MNRRNFLLGLLSVAAPLSVAPEAFTKLLLDGPQEATTIFPTEFILGDGDWTVDFWINVGEADSAERTELIDGFHLRSDFDYSPAEDYASSKGFSSTFDLIEVIANNEKEHVPVDGEWHNFFVTHDGRVVKRYLDGELLEEVPSQFPRSHVEKFGGSSLLFDGTGDYVAVP